MSTCIISFPYSHIKFTTDKAPQYEATAKTNRLGQMNAVVVQHRISPVNRQVNGLNTTPPEVVGRWSCSSPNEQPVGRGRVRPQSSQESIQTRCPSAFPPTNTLCNLQVKEKIKDVLFSVPVKSSTKNFDSTVVQNAHILLNTVHLFP